jgi:DNA-3-methyladenine glycosylase II
MTITTPREFSFSQCLAFLLRSPREILHRVEGGLVYKALQVERRPVVIAISEGDHSLEVQYNPKQVTGDHSEVIRRYISDWFDLETDLKPFYALAKHDPLLADLVKRYFGYRIVGQPDLYESITWAILGQQINLGFAYTLKQRFVEQFGQACEYDGQHYHFFPDPTVVAQLQPEQLLPLQFSRQKARYVIEVARAFCEGRLSTEAIRQFSFEAARENLMKVKGIGNWTANYALMKTFRHRQAFPAEDAGLHNAIRNLKGLKTKPTVEQVRRIFKKYEGWEAYATLYLWRSLV